MGYCSPGKLRYLHVCPRTRKHQDDNLKGSVTWCHVLFLPLMWMYCTCNHIVQCFHEWCTHTGNRSRNHPWSGKNGYTLPHCTIYIEDWVDFGCVLWNLVYWKQIIVWIFGDGCVTNWDFMSCPRLIIPWIPVHHMRLSRKLEYEIVVKTSWKMKILFCYSILFCYRLTFVLFQAGSSEKISKSWV